MAITNDTEFNYVLIYASDGHDGRYVHNIQLYLGSQQVTLLNAIRSNPFEGWDTTSDEFTIVKNAIDAGTATYRYRGPDGTIYDDDSLPLRHQWMKTANPLEQARTAEQEVEETDVNPSVAMIYVAQTAIPTAEPPSWSETNNTWEKWKAAIEAAGYVALDPPTPADGEFLWSIQASYSRIDGEYECYFDEWKTGGTLYSRDNGASWSSSPPARNTAGFSLVTHIRRYNASVGAWEDHPHNPQFQGKTGSALSQAARSTQIFNTGNNYIYASADLPRAFSIAHIQVGKTTHVGVELLLHDSWTSEVILRGRTDIAIDGIPMVAPHQFDSGDVVPLAQYAYLFKMDEGGAMSHGRIESVDRIDNYFGDHHRFVGYFESHPYGKLVQAISATDTELRFSSRTDDINIGEILHIVDDDDHESTRVTAINREQQGSGADAYYAITVSRGGGGTGAKAFPAGAKVSAVRRDQHIAKFVITKKANIHAASRILVHRTLDQ